MTGQRERLTARLALVFSAGAAGGLTNSLAVWLCGLLGVTGALGVAIAPTLSPEWLYPRMVWGGLWGVLFLIPACLGHPLLKGLLLSLGPTIVQLWVVFPFKASKGLMGLDLGTATPLFVLLFNAVWGLTAATIVMVSSKSR